MEISLNKIYKEYHIPHLIKALNYVSWNATSGDVLGILGPNGAGKSTTIKVLLNIINPENGSVLINGRPLKEMINFVRANVGYMPEERGLYQDEEILKQLVFLGTLKGLSKEDAKKKSLDLLERFGLASWCYAKLGALSKGMSFKVQLICCLLHNPQIVILDEPFYGLDPVNIRLVRNVIRELKNEGRLVLLSTHMMNEVEKLCNKIVMMNHGEMILYGDIKEIQRQFSNNEIIVNQELNLNEIPFIKTINNDELGKRISLNEGKTIYDLIQIIAEKKLNITFLQNALTSLEDIFIQIVKKSEEVEQC